MSCLPGPMVLEKVHLLDYINADEIKKNLKCSDYEAAELAEMQREKHLQNMEDFCFETVMGANQDAFYSAVL